MSETLTGLVGDVGGTNARFALAHVRAGAISIDEPKVLPAKDYPKAEDAVRAFLKDLNDDERPKFAVIAAAGPIERGVVTFTNNTAWRFSERDLERDCGLKGVRLINDFAAQALAIDHLKAGELHRIGPPGQPERHANAAIVGPGTGFGAAAQVDDGTHKAILTGEGPHAAFAPTDDVEIDIVRRLMKKFGRVSVERVLSGPGLLNVYEALAEIRGEKAVCERPDEVTEKGLAGDPLAEAALSRFCAILGSVAGDFALAYGARRGVYIAGGIAPRILAFLEASDFRARFEAKGRMSDYMKAIPTLVVTAPYSALTGSASLLPDLERQA